MTREALPTAAEIEAAPFGESIIRGWMLRRIAADRLRVERAYAARPWPDDGLRQRIRQPQGWGHWSEVSGSIHGHDL